MATQLMNITIRNKRFKNELKKLDEEPLHFATAYHDKDDPLIWYFLLVGQKGTDYHGGEYIGKIIHSPKYPLEAPDYVLLTPSGRYETNRKICLSNSGFHKNEWSSTWNIITILAAFYSIWIDDRETGLGHIKDTPEKRRRMAAESIDFNTRNYLDIYEKFNKTHLRDDDPPTMKSDTTEPTELSTIETIPDIINSIGPDEKEGEKADNNNDIVIPDELKEVVNEQINDVEPEFEPVKKIRKYKTIKKMNETTVNEVKETKPKTTRKKKNENN